VLKKLVGQLFGFDREIQELRRQVRHLSWDTSFGMWTRSAFLQFCEVMPRDYRVVAFIDLNRIHELNKKVGYTEVDRRVKATFSMSFRRSDVVARWYSGDEIVILFDSDWAGAEGKVDQLKESAMTQGLTFFYEIGDWKVGKEAIEEVVAGLADKVTQQKSLEPR